MVAALSANRGQAAAPTHLLRAFAIERHEHEIVGAVVSVVQNDAVVFERLWLHGSRASRYGIVALSATVFAWQSWFWNFFR